MSPILVRPVREQLEHDRVIRLLQAKYKRKFEVAINPGNEQNAPVGNESSPWFPDVVLQSSDRGHRLLGTVEVETTESVNHLEAMSQWATFSRLRAAFHLYVPTGCIDTTRRLITDLDVNVVELWAYQSVGDQIRFTLVQRSAAAEQKLRAAEEAEKAQKAEKAEKPDKEKADKNKVDKVDKAKPAAATARNGATTATRAGRTAPAARTVRRAAPAASARRKPAAKAPKPAVRRAAAKAPARKTSGSARSQKRR